MTTSWPTLALEELASVQRGKFSARPRNDPRYYGGRFPFIQTGDVSNGAGCVRSYSQTLNDEGLSVSKLFPKGSLVITIAANIGDVARVEFDFACPDSLVVVQANEGVDSDWLQYSLESKKELLDSLAPQNAQKNINLEVLRPLPLDVPSLGEQRRISGALVAWDTAIRKTEQLIAAKGLRLSALRTKLFARGNRPGYARVRLESILTETGELSDGSLPVYSVSVHKGLINQVEHLGRSFSAATTDHYNLVRPGDIVYTKSPTGEFPYGIVKQSLAKEDAAVSPLYGVYRPSTDDIGTLLDFYFQSPTNAKNYLHPLVQKGAKNTISITNDQFLKGEISLPESADQVARLARFVRESRTEIALLEESVAALTIQKRGLMQKLLTGHWRLPAIEGQPIPDHA